MTEKPVKVLLIEDNPGDARLIREMLAEPDFGKFKLEWAERLSSGLEVLTKGIFDVALLDLHLPDADGFKIVDTVHASHPGLAIIVVTGTYAEAKLGLESIRRGAQDYLTKDNLGGNLLRRSIHYSIERKLSTAKLQEVVDAKLAFTSMVSHELRTPLASIKDAIDLVMDGTTGPILPEQQEFLQMAKRNVDRLTRMINDVLDFQKLDMGRRELHRAPQDLNALIREVEFQFQVEASKKGLTLATQLEQELPLISFDKDAIVQVLINLVNNAIKFSSRGSVLIIAKHGDNWVRVSVRDEGPGIKEKDRHLLFQSFSQISADSSSRSKGTGLGLAISKKIIEQHQGRIGVTSTPGKGSTFYFILPIRERREV